MVSVNEVRHGVESYLNQEILPKLDGWKKWIAGAAASMAGEKAEHIVNMLKDHPVVQALELADDTGIDVETIYTHVLKEAEKGPARIMIPMIGTITLNADDVRKMYRCIMG